MSLRSALPLVLLAWTTLPGVAYGQGCTDTDGDGVCDADDNCLALFQLPSQLCDTDQDGYGNFCDADFNGDGYVSGVDYVIFGMYFGNRGELTTDLNCDEVTVPDWGIFNRLLGSPPGPSGLPCAGTIPCP